jgi:hypothetical protein
MTKPITAHGPNAGNPNDAAVPWLVAGGTIDASGNILGAMQSDGGVMQVQRTSSICAIRNRAYWFIATVLLGLAISTPANADKRVALVIGNSGYLHVDRLVNPRNDANLIAATLSELGFTLVGGGAQLDLDKQAIDHAVQEFGTQLQGADVGLFYYSGHGMQVRGSNYLVPIDANPTKEADVDFQMLDANLVLRQMEGAGTHLNLVILDACRNNPLAMRGFRSATSGLAQMQAPEGTLISFATQPGSVAFDGTDGNSAFTKALAQTIRRPGLGMFDAFNEVGLAVMRATGGNQQPWLATSPISGKFYFAGLPTGNVPTTEAPKPPIPTPPATAQPVAPKAVLAYGPPAAEETPQTRVSHFTWRTVPQEVDPGLRIWQREADGTWSETYPSGLVSRDIRVRARILLDNCAGTVVGPADESDFAVFIPDKGCRAMVARWRRGSGNHWNILGVMQNVR